MVCREVNKPLVLETVSVATPEAHEVRVKIIYSSVCHTDALVMSGQDTETPVDPEDGVILGHEAFAIVESIGDGVTNVAIGDYVIPAYIPECKECRFCKDPRSNLCQKIRVTQGRGQMPDGGSRFTDAQGRKLRHFMGISAFSQYSVCADISIVKIPQTEAVIALGDKLPIIGCGFTTGFGTVMNSALKEGESIAIIGLGGVGLAAVYAAAQKKAKQIIAIDINPKKFELAKKLGATHFINPKELGEKSLPSAVMEISEGGWGVDFSIEAVGSVTLMRNALEMTTKGWGTAYIIGVVCGQEVSAKSFYFVSGRSLTGAAYGNVKSSSHVPALVQDIADGKVVIDDFITGQRPLTEINQAFHDMHDSNGTAIRTVIKMFE